MPVQQEKVSHHVVELVPQACYYARVPMLLIDASGILVDTNAASRELFGLDLAGCKGQHFTYFLNRLRPQTEGPLLPADGIASTHFVAWGDGPSARPMPDLDTSELRSAVGECCYQSARFGRIQLRVSEVPCIDTESGACGGSIVGLEITNPIALTAFQGSLDGRLGHEVMWEVYAAAYDRILPEMPFYQEVVERHCAALAPEPIHEVLDVGAGTGSVTVPLLSLCKRVTAVDVGRAMLQRLCRKVGERYARQLTLIEDTAERMPQLKDASFDGVNVLLAFFDMQDPGSAFEEVQRLIRPGGTLVITEPRACFDLDRLMAAAEESLHARGLMGRLGPDWRRIQSVAPHVGDTVKGAQRHEAAKSSDNDWHAEAILELLREKGFCDLTFKESHFGNCATICGTKPFQIV